MEFMARCERCGALVEPRRVKLADGAVAYFTQCVVVPGESGNDMLGGHASESPVLCPDCIGQLREWLHGGQTKDPSTAESIIRDMYAALMARPHRKQACEYTTARRHEKCSECAFDPTQCVGEMFKDIRWRCAEIGIDLEEDEDAK